MNIPKFRYPQDVLRFIHNLNQQIDEDISQVNNHQKLVAHTTDWTNYIESCIVARRPKITEFNLVQASRLGNKFKTFAAFEEFVVTDSGTSNSLPKSVKLSLEKVVVPNINELKTNYAAVEDLYSKHKTLDSVEAQISMQFHGSSELPALLREIQQSKRRLEVAMRSTFNFLTRIANKHVPDSFLEYAESIMLELKNLINFKSVKNYLYTNINDAGSIVFTSYVLIKDVVNDEGEVAPSLYLSTQWNVGSSDDKAYLKMWLDYDFELPNVLAKRSDGKSVTSKENALKVAGNLLNIDNFSSAIGVVPLTLRLKEDPSAISKRNFSYREYVDSVEVDAQNNILRFSITKKGVDASALKKLSIALYPQVRSMLKVNRNAALRMKLGSKGKQWQIDFILAEIAKNNDISLDDLEFMKDKFGLTDRQLRRVADVFSM